MFNFNYGYWNWSGKPQENKVAIPIMSQDELRTQLRNTNETKPDAYKNSQSSSARFLQNSNLTAK